MKVIFKNDNNAKGTTHYQQKATCPLDDKSMTINLFDAGIKFLLVIIFGIVSLKLKIVDFTGFLASLLVGGAIFIFGGWKWFVLILTFHIVAGLSTKYKYEEKRQKGVAEEKKGARAWQNVLANGSAAAFLAVVNGFIINDVLFAGYLGAVSTAIADTLATEIGLLSPKQPRSIVNLSKEVLSGTSGGVSLLGEIASILSAGLIGLLTYITAAQNWNLQTALIISVVSGFFGSTFDSLLGATVQARYKCKVCGKNIEKKFHCEKHAIHLKGYSWIDNNMVNLLAVTFGSGVGILVFHLI